MLLQRLLRDILKKSSIRNVSYIEKKKNYYQILGVDRKATKDEIKKAFVKKSRELHPDLSLGTKTTANMSNWSRRTNTEQFMDVKEAYDTLRHTEKRRSYDQSTFLSEQDGYLHAASFSGTSKRDPTIVDLNLERNKAYMGPSRLNNTGGHFIDPKKVLEREKRRNRPLLYISLIFGLVIICNIVFIEIGRYNKRGIVK